MFPWSCFADNRRYTEISTGIRQNYRQHCFISYILLLANLYALSYIMMQCSIAIFEQLNCSYMTELAILPRELEHGAAGIVSLSGHCENAGLNVLVDWRR